MLVVRQDVIDQRPEVVQTLVDGIARSGLWLEGGKPYREYAAEFVGRYYFNQPPALLKWALTGDEHRAAGMPRHPFRRAAQQKPGKCRRGRAAHHDQVRPAFGRLVQDLVMGNANPNLGRAGNPRGSKFFTDRFKMLQRLPASLLEL